MKIMEMNDFCKKVREMREAQREYFRTRDMEFLQLSKRLEKQVDRMLKEMEEGEGLFG